MKQNGNWHRRGNGVCSSINNTNNNNKQHYNTHMMSSEHQTDVGRSEVRTDKCIHNSVEQNMMRLCTLKFLQEAPSITLAFLLPCRACWDAWAAVHLILILILILMSAGERTCSLVSDTRLVRWVAVWRLGQVFFSWGESILDRCPWMRHTHTLSQTLTQIYCLWCTVQHCQESIADCCPQVSETN